MTIISMYLQSLYPWRYWLLLCVLVISFWGLFRAEPPPALLRQLGSIFLHACAFFAIAIAARYASPRHLAKYTWILLLIAAVSSEYIQNALHSTRSFSYWDIIANLGGIVSAWLIWPLVAYFALPKHGNKSIHQSDHIEK